MSKGHLEFRHTANCEWIGNTIFIIIFLFTDHTVDEYKITKNVKKTYTCNSPTAPIFTASMLQ